MTPEKAITRLRANQCEMFPWLGEAADALEPLVEFQKQVREVFGYDVSISVAMTYIRSWKERHTDDLT